jgi:sulfate transport system permease protein
LSDTAERTSSALASRWAARSAAHLGRVGLRRLPAAGRGSIYLSLLVLVPVATVLSKAFSGGLSALWQEITQAETLSSIKLSLVISLVVVVVNSVIGTAIAWQLVRDRFVLNRVISAIVDLPFALPTIIAGVTLLSLYGSSSPFHVNIAFSRWSLLAALAFVTLPFAVRSVQPVLAALDRETEEAAASLGASSWTTFRRIILPSLAPALLTGAGIGFARAIGEYGSVSLISGNVPFKTEVASVRIFGLIESDNVPAAAATSLALFAVTIVVLTIVTIARRRYLPKEDGL